MLTYVASKNLIGRHRSGRPFFSGQNELYYTEKRNTERLSFRLPTLRCLGQQIRSGLVTDDKAADASHDKLNMDVDWLKGCFLICRGCDERGKSTRFGIRHFHARALLPKQSSVMAARRLHAH